MTTLIWYLQHLLSLALSYLWKLFNCFAQRALCGRRLVQSRRLSVSVTAARFYVQTEGDRNARVISTKINDRHWFRHNDSFRLVFLCNLLEWCLWSRQIRMINRVKSKIPSRNCSQENHAELCEWRMLFSLIRTVLMPINACQKLHIDAFVVYSHNVNT